MNEYKQIVQAENTMILKSNNRKYANIYFDTIT